MFPANELTFARLLTCRVFWAFIHDNSGERLGQKGQHNRIEKQVFISDRYAMLEVGSRDQCCPEEGFSEMFVYGRKRLLTQGIRLTT